MAQDARPPGRMDVERMVIHTEKPDPPLLCCMLPKTTVTGQLFLQNDRSPAGRPDPTHMMHRLNIALTALACMFCTTFAQAQSVPPGFTRTTLPSVSSATCMTVLPDGRYLIANQTGQVRVWKNGTVLATPAHTIPVVTSSEAGLIGMTIDPDFASNGYVYIHATVQAGTGGVAKVFRFTMPAGSDVSELNSQIELLECGPSSGIHNGGALHFGVDGHLYIAIGDRANRENAQNLTTFSGKILRIHPDGSIPTDNPFYSSASDNFRAIWCRGLRNPFTFAFHPRTGRMLINDVGSQSEEVNEGRPGRNFGWPQTEGFFNPNVFLNFTNPILALTGNAEPAGITGRTVIGAAFYHASTPQFPESYRDGYFFGSFNAGTVRWMHPTAHATTAFASGFSNIVDLDVDRDGSLLVLTRNNGLFRIAYTNPVGACCTGDTCTQTLVDACAALGGRFFGVAVPCPPTGASCCPADLNTDTRIDLLDLLDFLTDWSQTLGTSVPTGGPQDYFPDGASDVRDLLEFISDWSGSLGQACPLN